MACPYVRVDFTESPQPEDEANSVCVKTRQRKNICSNLSAIFIGIALVVMLEVFGRLAKTVVNDTDESGLMLTTMPVSTIDVCFKDINAEQPLYISLIGGYTQSLLNGLVFPTNVKMPVKMSTFALATILIGLKASTTVKDISFALSAPWYCLQVLGTGTSQMVTILQTYLRLTTLGDATEKYWGWEYAHKGHVVILIAYLIVTLPYIPLILVTLPYNILPGCLIFIPVVLFFGLIMFCSFAVAALLLTAVFGDKPMTDDIDGGHNQVMTSLGSLCAVVAVFLKFVGEATARFYAGEGWWGSIYSTWAGRTLKAYVSSIFQTFGNIMSTSAFFL